MNNEERIRKWRQERGSRGARTALLGDDPIEDVVAKERLERPGPGGASAPGTTALPPGASVEDARLAILKRRQIRWRRIRRRVGLFVLVPALAILFYLWAIATPLYQGEAVFTVQTSSDSAPSPNAGLFALGTSGSTIGDAFKGREFIISRAMMDYMEKRHGFLSHFATREMDPLTRFQSPLGLNQDPHRYYRKRVRVAVDVQEGILRLYVQARTPQDAVRFGNAILAAAEAHVNAFSDKISRDQIDALTRDVQDAERQVAESRRSLAAVQARRGDLSPEQTATVIYQLISNLEQQRAEAERERNALLSQGLTNSPLLPNLSARVAELTAQIAAQRRRLVNPGGGSLQQTANEYETASARKEIAQARWESMLNTLQQASLRVLQQRRYFVLIVGMSVATFPKVRDVLTIAWPILLFIALVYALVFAARRAGFADWSKWPRGWEVMDRWRRR